MNIENSSRDHSRVALSYIKFIATILITNAHIGPLYPSSLVGLSTGGALGNSLFFFCSGYALFLSPKIKFKQWIVRRYSKIYPCLWIFLTICYLLGNSKIHFSSYIIPSFWFLQAILVFYVLFYFTCKYFNDFLCQICFFTCIPFLITYFFFNNHNSWIIEETDGTKFLHWYFYFIIMLLGAITAKKNNTIVNIRSNILQLIICLTIYYSTKIIILHSKIEFYDLQLLIPILLSVIALLSFNICIYIASLKFNGKIHKSVLFISNLTLPIYIIQFSIMGYFSQYKFPYGFTLSICSILLGAIILNLMSTKTSNYLRNKIIL